MKTTQLLICFLMLMTTGITITQQQTNSLEGEKWMWKKSSNTGYQQSFEFYFTDRKHVHIRWYYEGGGYYVEEIEGDYIYNSATEEVFIKSVNSKSFAHGSNKYYLRLEIKPGRKNAVLFTALDWKKTNNTYSPERIINTIEFNKKTETDAGYTLESKNTDYSYSETFTKNRISTIDPQ